VSSEQGERVRSEKNRRAGNGEEKAVKRGGKSGSREKKRTEKKTLSSEKKSLDITTNHTGGKVAWGRGKKKREQMRTYAPGGSINM